MTDITLLTFTMTNQFNTHSTVNNKTIIDFNK